MKTQEYKYVLLLHFVVVIWSTTVILGKLISVGSGVLVWYRMGIAVLGIAVYLGVTRKSFKLPRTMLLKTLLVGLLVAAHWVCFFESIKRSNVSIILVCLSLAPFLISFIEPILFKRRFRPYEGVLGVLSVAGMASIFTFEYQYVAGIVIGIISVSFSSLFAVINGIFVRQYESCLISFYELLGGFLGVSVYVFIYQRTPLGNIAIEWVDLGYLFILGLICTSFAFVLSVEVMRVLTPFSTMMIVNLEPIYGIVLALLIFGEAEIMSLEFYIGAGLIIVSIFAHGILKRRFEPSVLGKGSLNFE